MISDISGNDGDNLCWRLGDGLVTKHKSLIDKKNSVNFHWLSNLMWEFLSESLWFLVSTSFRITRVVYTLTYSRRRFRFYYSPNSLDVITDKLSGTFHKYPSRPWTFSWILGRRFIHFLNRPEWSWLFLITVN